MDKLRIKWVRCFRSYGNYNRLQYWRPGCRSFCIWRNKRRSDSEGSVLYRGDRKGSSGYSVLDIWWDRSRDGRDSFHYGSWRSLGCGKLYRTWVCGKETSGWQDRYFFKRSYHQDCRSGRSRHNRFGEITGTAWRKWFCRIWWWRQSWLDSYI